MSGVGRFPSIFVLVVGLAVSGVVGVAAQDAASERIQKAWERYRAWEESDGGEVPAELEQDIEALWKMRADRAEDPERLKAAGEALHLLVHLERLDDLKERIAPFDPDDPLAERIVELVAEAGRLTEDRTLLIQTVERWLPEIEDSERGSRLRLLLGDALADEGRMQEARETYRAVVEARPDSEAARVAEGSLYELSHLQIGDPVPAFTLETLEGGKVSREQLAGRVVIVDAWASW